MSGAGPEVLFGLNQRPERVSIHPFHLLQERSNIRPPTLSSWLKQTILLCYKQADQQTLDLVQVKAHDIRAVVASKAFYGGVSDQIIQPVTGKLTTHLQILPKRPYLVRQQYVSGTSGGGTTNPRSFPSDQLSSERKEGGVGGHPLQPSLQEFNPRV